MKRQFFSLLIGGWLVAVCLGLLLTSVDAQSATELVGSCPAADLDEDGVTDDLDNCVFDFNTEQDDSDGNGVGDACDGGSGSDDLTCADEGYAEFVSFLDPDNAAIMEGLRIEGLKDEFRAACNANKVDPKICEAILEAALGTPKPGGPNPCKKWAEAVDPKLPARTPNDVIKDGKGTIAGQVAWVYKPCASNLWCLFVNGHFAIRVKFPDGKVFYFDDGNWGRIFGPGDIPSYAK